MKKIILIAVLIMFSVGNIGCSRQPSAEQAYNLTTKYFKKYSKEYPESIFAKFPPNKFQMMHMEVIHKNLVVANVMLTLNNGMSLQARMNLFKRPFGWKVISWENMGITTN